VEADAVDTDRAGAQLDVGDAGRTTAGVPARAVGPPNASCRHRQRGAVVERQSCPVPSSGPPVEAAPCMRAVTGAVDSEPFTAEQDLSVHPSGLQVSRAPARTRLRLERLAGRFERQIVTDREALTEL